MNLHSRSTALTALTALALSLPTLAQAFLFGASRSKPPAEKDSLISVEHGPFRIVGQARRISTGTFPNQGGNPFATMEVTGFRVLYRDQPVVIRHGSRTLEQFWRVSTLPDAPRPALLLSTTDFHLVTEVNGQLSLRSLGRPTTDMATYQWLDGADGQPTEPASFGIERVRLDQLPLTGGRWLLLSTQAVLDVKTLQVHPVDYHVPQGQPLQGVGGTRALVLSPGQTQYVTWGSSVTLVEDGEYVPGLSVVDIRSGRAYGLRLRPGEKRFHEEEDLTPRWLSHYYEWRREPGGPEREVERLVERRQAPPLPYTGRLQPQVIRIAYRSGEVRHPTMTYLLRPATPALADAFEQFAVSRFGAQRSPAANPYLRQGLQLPGCPGGLELKVYFGSSQEMRLVLEAVSSRYEDRTACAPVVEQIGRAFNEELGQGRHQGLFTE